MPNKFIPTITRVKGISERRRLPRLGKIRLGIKVLSQKTGKTYPKETDFFVCEDPKIRKIFGEEPKELEVMFPVNSLDIIFPQAYTMYGSTKGIKCKGDGETAVRLDESTGSWNERPCPCEYLDQKKCALRGHLQFMIPRVNMGGIYQLDTGSYNSTIDVNSGLDFISALVGRFNMIPLKLLRVPRETHGEGTKQTHYTLHVKLDGTLEEISRIRSNPDKIFARNDEGDLILALGMSATEQYALDAPVDENPEFDEGGITKVEENGGEPLAPGTVLEFLSLSDFGKLTKEEMIAYLSKVAAATKKELPTPAPLDDHSLAELKDLYKRLYKMIFP